MTKSIHVSDDLAAIRSQTREYVEKEIVPRATAWETGGVPRDVLDDMAKLGFFGLRVPEEHGGSGLGALASVVFAEELLWRGSWLSLPALRPPAPGLLSLTAYVVAQARQGS